MRDVLPKKKKRETGKEEDKRQGPTGKENEGKR